MAFYPFGALSVKSSNLLVNSILFLSKVFIRNLELFILALPVIITTYLMFPRESASVFF